MEYNTAGKNKDSGEKKRFNVERHPQYIQADHKTCVTWLHLGEIHE